MKKTKIILAIAIIFMAYGHLFSQSSDTLDIQKEFNSRKEKIMSIKMGLFSDSTIVEITGFGFVFHIFPKDRPVERLFVGYHETYLSIMYDKGDITLSANYSTIDGSTEYTYEKGNKERKMNPAELATFQNDVKQAILMLDMAMAKKQ